MKADIIVKGGRILDPSIGMDCIGDIVIANGKIVAVGDGTSYHAGSTLDAEGYLVTPGWIDIHAHIFHEGTWNGMPADLAAIPMGITAIVDAGSTGVSNYQELIRQLSIQRVRSKIMLNISACGIIMPTQFPEPVDPSVWNLELFDKAFARYSDYIMGLKLRLNRGVVKELGLKPLEATVQLAERYGTRVIVHVTDAPEPMNTIANILRAGDVFCHVSHGTGYTILDRNGNILEGIQKARERGVIFDAASGRSNFSLEVAQKMVEQNFLPDSISSDVTLQNWNHPLAGQLPFIMSRWAALGMSLPEIVKRTTSEPAKQLGIKGLGTLLEGTIADITVMKIEEKEMEYRDKFGHVLLGNQVFLPKATIIGGEILYRAVDCFMDQESTGNIG